jgi:hypothetical protein
MEMVKKVAHLAKGKGLKVTMGGSISKATRLLVLDDKNLRDILDYVETRKVVMPVDRFIEEGALTEALKLETFLLDRRIAESEKALSSAIKRKNSINSRV